MSAGSPAMPALAVFDCPLDGVSLIEASAGTGKTWNICALYLRLLLEKGLGVEQILVVTFTKAATAELRTRIRERLQSTLAAVQAAEAGSVPTTEALLARLGAQGAAASTLSAALQAALARFDEAAIHTIHGFSQRALGDAPFASGQPFALEVVQDDAALRAQIAADFWRREVSHGDLHPALLRELAARDSPARWAALLARRQTKPLARLRWPEAKAPALESAASARQQAWQQARALWMSAAAAALAELEQCLPGLKANMIDADKIARCAKLWHSACTLDAPESLAEASLFTHDHLARACKKSGQLPSHPFFAAASSFAAAAAALQAALGQARLQLLRRLFEAAPQAMHAAKLSARSLAFDDMLPRLHQALLGQAGTALAQALRARYPAALIDEFQDTDPLQLAVFRQIYATQGPLFLVGDPKQAIYSFRSADLHTYLAARDEATHRYTLVRNQRSVSALIRACNALFGANPGAFVLDGLHYQPVERGDKAHPELIDNSADGASGSLRLWQFGSDAEGRPPQYAEAQAQAVAATANEIVRLLSAAQAGAMRIGERALEAGDIAVLVRSHRQAALVREALAQRGVAAVELSQASVFTTLEAEELERILIAVSEAQRSERLFAALATTLLGASAAELLALRDDEAALQAWVERFAAYREQWAREGLGVMLRQLAQREGIITRLLQGARGERRVTNLLHLFELLQQTASELPGVDALLRELARLRREHASGQGHADTAQLRLESDRRLVQIVTIHRAKGLEYAITFCPLLWQGSPRSRSEEGIEYRCEGESVLDMRPEAAADDDIKAQREAEQAAEDMRLIYVALSRAVYRCYLVVGCQLRRHGRTESATQSCRSLLNWLAAGGGMRWPAWRSHKLAPQDIDAAWQALAASAAPELCLAALPVGAAHQLTAPAQVAQLAVLPPPTLARAWRIGSFSRLAHEQAGDAVRDTDALVARLGPGATPAGIPANDILHFPRGAAAGDCLHAAFEHADFSAPSSFAAAARAALQRHPQTREAQRDGSERLQNQIENLLSDVTRSELLPGLRLADIAPAQRLTEFAFHLPAPTLEPAALNRWLAGEGYAVPQLAFAPMQGYLAGFIDLVFAHAGRYWVLDWKSNLLGFEPSAYAQAALAGAMRDNAYHLQALLYSLALHRHLGRRLPGYTHAQHFGGVLYLFVRGVRPHWRDAAGQACGVFHQCPSAATLAALEQLIAGPTP